MSFVARPLNGNSHVDVSKAAEKQLERTVIRRRVRAASAPFHMRLLRAGQRSAPPLNCGVMRHDQAIAARHVTRYN